MLMRLWARVLMLSLTPALAEQGRGAAVTVRVSPQCGISISNSRFELDAATNTSSGEIFFRFGIRTSRAGGSGSIKLKSDDPGRRLTFSSRVEGAGATPSGTQTTASGEPAVVATFPADAHSTTSSDAGSISWSMTGAYAPAWNLTIECQ